MFDTRPGLFFFAGLKDAAGAVLKSAALALNPGSDQQKNRLRLRSRPKSGGSCGSGSATFCFQKLLEMNLLWHRSSNLILITIFGINAILHFNRLSPLENYDPF